MLQVQTEAVSNLSLSNQVAIARLLSACVGFSIVIIFGEVRAKPG